MKTYYWLIKREFWENRGSFLWAPVIATGVFLALNIMGIITFEVFAAKHGIRISGLNIDQLVHNMNGKDMANLGVGIDLAMMSASSLLGIVLGIVVFFYCLGSLYDDRRDRSILFWKSLPISDRDTVFSKALSAAILAPVIATICGLIGAVVMLLMVMLVAAFHGVHLWALLGHAHPIRTMATIIAIIPVNLVWALPTIGWLMLCSAWAKNKPFLWALAIPVGLGIMVSWFGFMGLFDVSNGWFWKNIVVRSLFSVFPNGWIDGAQVNISGSHGFDLSHHFDKLVGIGTAWSQLGRADFLVGGVIGLAMITAAIWFRGRRDDS
jgi:ABC-2 type transport system permease protein